MSIESHMGHASGRGAVVRLGIIGLGNMGTHHAQYLTRPEGSAVAAVQLAATCDSDEGRRIAAARFNVPAFSSHQELLAAGICDAVLIATPHYHHVPIALDALPANVHVLVEKPLAVTVTEARRLIAAARTKPHLVLGIMYNQRTNPLYQKMRELVHAGAIGRISRITWIVTNWFRTHAYYGSSPWRATWSGEGGGVLINQCPHNLDLLSYITGLSPTRVTAVGFTGKTHPIETEDEISAILEYPPAAAGEPGAMGHFITSTGEFPGANRLEICGSRGKLLAENGTLVLSQTAIDVQAFSQTSPNPFGSPELTHTDIPIAALPLTEHQTILRDFAEAVLSGRSSASLIAPGAEGIVGLELGNAIMMAGLTRQPVQLPLADGVVETFLARMTCRQGVPKGGTAGPSGAAADFSASFAKR